MHALVSTAAATAALLVASFACAQDQPRTAAGETKAQANQPAAASHNSAQAHRDADHARRSASANQSRYRRHNGRWWYWMPDRRWVVWQRNGWVPYRPGMFADENAATLQPTRRYSYEPQGYPNVYPRLYQSPSPYGVNQSIRNAASKANFDYNPYTGGSMQ